MNKNTTQEQDSANEMVDIEGFEHVYAEVNGTRIHYVIGGTGSAAVVLLHGFPYTWATWRKLMPLLVDAGFTVITPDLRGLGDSEKAASGYAKSNVAEDIRQIVKLLDFGQINLVGTDIGMMVAYAYASRHPEEIRRLVLAESLIPGFGLEELMNPATGGYWHFGFHMQVAVAEMLTQGKEKAYLLPTMKMLSTSKEALETAENIYLPHYIKPGGMRAGFEHYGTLLEDGKENRAAFKEKLKLPVLVLNGEKSMPQEQTLSNVRRVAENVEVDLVPSSGHTLADDNPEWLAARLQQFFA